MLYATRNAHLCRWRESAVEWNQVLDTPRWRCPYPGMQSPAEAEAALAAPCSGRHGALHTPGEGGISYMICYDVPESGVPEGYHRPAVPAVTLAVLPTRKDSPREQGSRFRASGSALSQNGSRPPAMNEPSALNLGCTSASMVTSTTTVLESGYVLLGSNRPIEALNVD